MDIERFFADPWAYVLVAVIFGLMQLVKWMVEKWKPEWRNAGWFKALKKGGVLGIIEHRRNESKPHDSESGYIHQKRIVDLMVKNGFELAASSELNSNPKDTKDHPEGVWTLPPSLALGEAESAKYLAIGESDRMTLKFVKP